jgi:cytochrome c peroxidase
MKKFGILIIVAVAALLLFQCRVEYDQEPIIDYSETEFIDSSRLYKVELGRRLFYEPALSRDSSVSCSVCHKQDLAFTDGLPKSIGIRNQEVTRNAPTLTNVGNRIHFLLDGVNPSLESQAGVPFQETTEFDLMILIAIDRLNSNPEYVELAKKGYNSDFTEFVLLNSIAEFERTLISNNSPHDQYLAGDKNALTESEIRGKKLFFDKLYCTECHSGSDFTNERFTNNGLYERYADVGRMRLTEKQTDRGIFKVPTLRNIGVTAPYMHDGSLSTLEDVIRHYESGGANHPGKGKEIAAFKLTDSERTDLIHFLEALTDSTFLTNPDFYYE